MRVCVVDGNRIARRFVVAALGPLGHEVTELEPVCMSQVLQAVQTHNWAEAERQAHTVRGVAGNLSAKDLASAAGDLEKARRTPEPAM